MNQALLGAIINNLFKIAGVAATTTGVATSGEVSSITTNATTAIGALTTLVTVGISIYSRLQKPQAKSTAKLPAVSQVVMKDGSVFH